MRTVMHPLCTKRAKPGIGFSIRESNCLNVSPRAIEFMYPNPKRIFKSNSCRSYRTANQFVSYIDADR